MWGCKVWRCEGVRMWRWTDSEDVKMKMWRCEDVKMRRCEDEKMWGWRWEKIVRWEDVEDEKGVKMRRCEDEKIWRWEDGEDVKMFDRPPLLEEPFAQMLSGKTQGFVLRLPPQHECIVMWCKVSRRPSWMYCYVMWSLTPPFMNVLLWDVKSHATLHECIVMWCKSFHTALHECIVMVWCKVTHHPSCV